MATKKVKKVKKKADGNTHWKNLFPYEHLGSHNLLPDEELIAKIKKIEEEEVGRKPRKGDKDPKKDKEILPVMHFEGDIPKMVLNKTNAATIAKLYGPDYTKWIGKWIQIFATEVNAFGEKTTALRVRDVIPENTEAKVDVSKQLGEMRTLKTLDELQAYFKGLKPSSLMLNAEIVALKDELKTTLK